MSTTGADFRSSKMTEHSPTGDLKGHAIPGSFFILFGVWMAVNCLRKHLSCQRERTKYRATSSYTLDCFQGRISVLPVEGFVKVIVSAGGMLGELLAHLPVPPVGIVQHATMYFFFLLSGVVDITLHYGTILPPKTDFISLAGALVVEGLLFVSHVHGRSELDTHVHMLLVYVIYLTAAIILLEAKFTHSVILSISRAFLFMLHGSWFWAVGVILYGHGDNQVWNRHSHDSAMLATIYFTWHCAAHFILLIILTLLLKCCYRVRDKNSGSSLGNDVEKNRRLCESSSEEDNEDV